MKRTWIIAAALIAAMLATPVMACTDWKEILALDAIISDQIRSELETAIASGEEPDASLLKEDFYHKLDVINDTADARAGNCYTSERPRSKQK